MLTRFLTLFTAFIIFVSVPSFAAKPAPDFSLPTFPDNATIKLSDFKGRVVYLDFWATWCPPCRESFPWMDEMHELYHEDGLTIIAISVDKKRELIEQFINRMEPAFIIAQDTTGKAAKSYKLRGMPSTYLINRKGELVMTHMGFRDSDKNKLESVIQSLIDE